LQLASSVIDDFMPHPFSFFNSLFGKPHSLLGAFAHRLCASFRFPYVLFHSTENFGSLKNELQYRPTVISR
jgi:hypothetical protein